jgi:hypothetical protein
LVQRFGGLGDGTAVGNGRMLGRGPYTSVQCPPSHDLAQKLAGTLDELREAAQGGQWTIHWRPIDEACQRALAADQGGNFAESIRQYCRGITLMMGELRGQQEKKASDSAIQY